MTIIGFERRTDGSKNLLVFDPMFQPSPGMTRLVNGSSRRIGRGSGGIKELMKAYRRGERYLKKFTAFETLQ